MGVHVGTSVLLIGLPLLPCTGAGWAYTWVQAGMSVHVHVDVGALLVGACGRRQ